jgi:threonine/homoserine/homoserine lactone efflux protein
MDNFPVVGRGFLVGFVVSAGSVGPLSMLFARRTLAQGRLIGFFSGLGVAAGDSISSTIAALGLSFVAALLLQQEVLLRIIGGAITIIVGTLLARSIPNLQQPAPTVATLAAAFLSTFGLTVATPSGIPVFIWVFTLIGVPIQAGQVGAALTFGLGVLVGASCLRFLQTMILGSVRGRLHTKLRLLTLLAGTLVILFGVVTLVTGIYQLVTTG